MLYEDVSTVVWKILAWSGVCLFVGVLMPVIGGWFWFIGPVGIVGAFAELAGWSWWKHGGEIEL